MHWWENSGEKGTKAIKEECQQSRSQGLQKCNTNSEKVITVVVLVQKSKNVVYLCIDVVVNTIICQSYGRSFDVVVHQIFVIVQKLKYCYRRSSTKLTIL